MKVEQLYTNCLAHGAYYIESNGESAIIDPLREVQPYIDIAQKRQSTIKYIFETHFHADFVSGHIDLSKKTGAPIIYGPTSMQTGFNSIIGQDGQIFKLGNVQIKLIHTPGHTMESSCYLLIDENGKETALFSGDTLFIGDVGRPDLAQHVISDLTQEKLAGHLFDSLRNKIMPLADDIIVYPAHGAGSACGKNLSKETSDSLGHQKQTNYALNPSLSKESFIKELLNGLTTPPSYFPKNVLLNINGYEAFDDVVKRGLKPLDANTFESIRSSGDVLVIDFRTAKEFSKGFIPESINIGLDGSFAVWVGTLVADIKQQILLVGDEDRMEEAITRLARVGYDYTIGYLNGGIQAWIQAGYSIETVPNISVEEFAAIESNHPEIQILDVRKKSEYDSEHISNALNIPLDYINENMHSIDPEKEYYVHCAGGYRSMIFISILKARGYNHLINVDGGFSAIKQSNKFKVTDYICPTTML